MEHEAEKTIREKINSVEQLPVSWEKEMVRSRISLPGARKSFAFYYAAAALLLSTSIFFYSRERTKQVEFAVRLKMIELSIEQHRSGTNQITSTDVAVESPCTEQITQKTILNNRSPAKTVGTTILRPSLVTSITRDQKDTKEVRSAVIVEQKTNEKSTALIQTKEAVDLPSPTKVQAIIGGDEAITAAVPQKQKKLRFRLFSPEEELPPVVTSSETITLLSKINP